MERISVLTRDEAVITALIIAANHLVNAQFKIQSKKLFGKIPHSNLVNEINKFKSKISDSSIKNEYKKILLTLDNEGLYNFARKIVLDFTKREISEIYG